MKHWIEAALGLLLLALAPAAAATTAVRLSDADLVRAADVIVVGRCTGVEPTWIGRDLVTLATVEVREQLEGEPRRTLTVVLPGGVDRRRRVPVAVTWPGAPTLAAGEEVVLFLARRDPLPPHAHAYTVVGFAQGKFSLVAGADGEPRVRRDLGGMVLHDADGGRRGGVRGEPLDAFLGRVRALLAAAE